MRFSLNLGETFVFSYTMNRSLGYYAVFSSSGVLALSAVAYVIFVVRESIHKSHDSFKTTTENKAIDTTAAGKLEIVI